jgi:recombination protein RecT
MSNTTGVIQQVSQHKAKTPAAIMSSVVNHEETQKLIRNSLKENAGAFTASVIDLYNSDKYLQECDPRKVMAECLKAVSLKLPINKQLGFAYVIAYKDKGVPIPQFQIGYKGYIQLCMRSGAYKHINAGPVYDGEFRSYNKLTSELDINGEAVSDTVVGYFAYIETNNGFAKAVYWSKEQVIKHAKRYSKSYNNAGSAWTTNFDEMATKTVLRHLLSHYALMSVDLEKAIVSENTEMADELINGESSPALDENIIPIEAETKDVTEA